MTRPAPLRRVLAAAVLITAAVCSSAGAQPRAALLDVPYLPQTEALCGGAAAAMVMRYWGAADIHAAAFAPLVDHSAGGIRTDALVSELQRRGWIAVAGPGTAADVQLALGRGRPVIALIEDSPGHFHYVVIVAWAGGKVILHDPARVPFRVVSERQLDAKWSRSSRWMLELLPPPGFGDRKRAGVDPVAQPHAGRCGPDVDRAVAAAVTGRAADARAQLQSAAAGCPTESPALAELAGLDAAAADWSAAAAHAGAAVSRDPTDEYAWRLLATAEYVRHDDTAALAAWNHIGEPRVDLVNVTGLQRIRFGIVDDAIGLPVGALVTPEKLRLADRRLHDLPAIAAASVAYHPSAAGRAQVDAAVVERDRYPASYPAWIAIGLDAAIDRTVSATVASPSGGGETLTGTWRWWTHRPLESFAMAAPAPRAVGGVWRAEFVHETQTFGPVGRAETHTGATASLRHWLAHDLVVEGVSGIERWRGSAGAANGTAISGASDGSAGSGAPDGSAGSGAPDALDGVAGGSATLWRHGDRLRLTADGRAWLGARNFARGAFSAAWQSNSALRGTVWLARAGYTVASSGTPLSLWPGADTGHARDVLLRAHPLLADGIIRGGVYGRRLAWSGGEVEHWLKPGKWLVRVAPAAFVDVARASRGEADSILSTQADVGVGVRLAVPGMATVRFDLAHGARDGRTALSVAVVRPF